MASEVLHLRTQGTRAALIGMFVGAVVGGCAGPREGVREAAVASRGGGFYHTVRRGDTLSAIARRYGVSASAVASDNALADPDHVEAGQRLFIRAPDPGPPRRSEKAAVRRLVKKATGRFGWPVRGKVVVRYGQAAGGEPVRGIVIRPSGDGTVRAADGGLVVFARERVRGYGGLVALDHGSCWTSVYARLTRVLVREGGTVAQGEAIAGAGGEVEFRLYRWGAARDPLPLLR